MAKLNEKIFRKIFVAHAMKIGGAFVKKHAFFGMIKEIKGGGERDIRFPGEKRDYSGEFSLQQDRMG